MLFDWRLVLLAAMRARMLASVERELCLSDAIPAMGAPREVPVSDVSVLAAGK